jgi:hypothetical protein
MNACQLAQAAADSARPLRGILAPEVVEKVERAFVAQWIDSQDESTPAAAVLKTARLALSMLRNRDEHAIA